MRRWIGAGFWTALVLGFGFGFGLPAADAEPPAPTKDGYPGRSIKLIVPFGPGGGTDIYARIIKRAIEEEKLLPHPLVVINRGGGGGTIGSRSVKDAPADGYTMMVLHDAILTAQLSQLVDYGPESFQPIAATGEVGMVIAVADSFPHADLPALMKAASEKPDTISFGANIGALTHYAQLQLEALTPGSRFRFAPIGGGAERFANLRSGQIDVTGFSIEEFVRFRPDGLRGLAYFGAERHPAAADVPTAREMGFDVVSTNTFYWWFPRGVASDRVNYMAEVLRRALQSPRLRAKLAEIHCNPIFVQGAALRRRLRASRESYAQLRAGLESPIPHLPLVLLGATLLLGGLAVVAAFRAPIRSVDSGPAPDSSTSDPAPDEEPVEDAAANRSSGSAATASPPARWRLALAAFACTLSYVALLGARLFAFAWVTAAYVFLLSALLTGWAPRRWLLPVALALLAGFGLQYVFTEWLIIDLPSSGNP